MTVAVLSGGSSLEREVSLRSGNRVVEALRDCGRDVVIFDLDERLVANLTDAAVEVVFMALHGQAGEDGGTQQLLDLLELPYTGSDATASALAWDKSVSKGVLRRAGLATPDWSVISADAVRGYGAGRALETVAARLAGPVMVKPVQGGASLGVRLVAEGNELADAVLAAFQYHPSVLLEQVVIGTEIAVSVVDGTPLPAVEIDVPDGVYDFAARYTYGAARFHVPARLPEPVAAACADLARAAWDALGCRHVMRADLMVDGSGIPWILEVDTCPGLTETSLLPMAAHAGGLSFPELCENLIALAVGDTIAA